MRYKATAYGQGTSYIAVECNKDGHENSKMSIVCVQCTQVNRTEYHEASSIKKNAISAKIIN